METLGFNLDIFWWGLGGIILTTAGYFVTRNILKNVSEDELSSEDRAGAMKWFRIIATSFWVLWFVGMILFHGVKWTAKDTADMGSSITAEKAIEYKAPSKDEILKMNREAIKRKELEREQEIKEENQKSSEEYEKFLSESN
jgi:hypothetical protein